MSSFDQAVTELFHRRFGSLFRYLDRLTGDPDLANDLAQETFVRLYQRGDIPDDPHAWLATVATNLLRDTHRSGRRRAELIAEHADDALLSPTGFTDDDLVVAAESRERVHRALDTLPERDKRLLLLRHEGFSYRELARACGVAETSVGTLLARATHAFRAAFTNIADAHDSALD